MTIEPSSIQIIEFQSAHIPTMELTKLLYEAYVSEGYTPIQVAEKIFAPEEILRRGVIFCAVSNSGELLGMVICAKPDNPYRQVAATDEAEMQLLAVRKTYRNLGLAQKLITAFEEQALALHFQKAVLSTQITMKTAHHLYEKQGYQRAPARDWTKNERSFLVFTKALRSARAG